MSNTFGAGKAGDRAALDFQDFFNIGFDVVSMIAADAGNRLALLYAVPGGERTAMTYWELDAASNRVANVLRAHGIGARDVALLAMPRTPAWWSTALGALKRGAVLMIVDSGTDASTLARHVVAAGARAVIADTAFAAMLDTVRDAIPSVREWMVIGESERSGWASLDAECAATSGALLHIGYDEMTRPGDPMFCVPFVGSDGVERVAVHAHSYVAAQREAARAWLGIGPSDLHWTLLPAAWTPWSWCGLFAELAVGATIVAMPDAAALDPDAVLALMASAGVTSFCTTPSLYRALTARPMKGHDLSNLRQCTCAGAIDFETVELWKDGTEGIAVRGGFGRADTALLAGVRAGRDEMPGAYGPAFGAHDLAVVDDRGLVLPPPSSGRLAAAYDPRRPFGLPLRYLDPAQDAAAFVGDRVVIDVEVRLDAAGVFAPMEAAPAGAPLVYSITPPHA